MSLIPVEGGIDLLLHIQPQAKRTEFAGQHGDRIKIRVHAPPVDGKANAEIGRFLAEFFQRPTKDVLQVSGEASRQKRFRVLGVDESAARQKLKALGLPY